MNTATDPTMTDLRLILQSIRDCQLRPRFGLRVCVTAALLITGLVFVSRALVYADTVNLTGTYMADNVQVRAPGHIGAVATRGRGASETVPLWMATTLPQQPNKAL
jgi:hypothetical protein